jgi:mycothiol synthase
MDRATLEDLPEIVLPERCRLATFGEVTLDQWLDVLRGAFPDRGFDADRWSRAFIEKPHFRPDGAFFVRTDDSVCATAFAWLDDPDEQEMGRVHWVGALPECRGLGLGRAVTIAVLRFLRDLGMSSATLDTDLYRLPAIGLYLSLGFAPVPRTPTEERHWAEVLAKLGATYS